MSSSRYCSSILTSRAVWMERVRPSISPTFVDWRFLVFHLRNREPQKFFICPISGGEGEKKCHSREAKREREREKNAIFFCYTTAVVRHFLFQEAITINRMFHEVWMLLFFSLPLFSFTFPILSRLSLAESHFFEFTSGASWPPRNVTRCCLGAFTPSLDGDAKVSFNEEVVVNHLFVEIFPEGSTDWLPLNRTLLRALSYLTVVIMQFQKLESAL